MHPKQSIWLVWQMSAQNTVDHRNLDQNQRALRMRTLVSCLIFIWALSPVVASPFEEADAAYKRGDYAHAISLIRPLAEQGDAAAQNNLGSLYYNGDGVERDYTEAASWFRRAAEQGNATAQNSLGASYINGRGVKMDYAEAVKWYHKAAEQGFPDAQKNLGVLYLRGDGLPRDDIQAFKWCALSANRSTPDNRLDQAITCRATASKNMTKEQLSEARKQINEWKPK